MDKRAVPVLFAGLAAIGGCSAAPEPTQGSVGVGLQPDLRAESYTGSFWSDFYASGCSILSRSDPYACPAGSGYPDGSLCTWDAAACSSDFPCGNYSHVSPYYCCGSGSAHMTFHFDPNCTTCKR